MSIYKVSKIDGKQYSKSNGAFTKHLKEHGMDYRGYYEIYQTGVCQLCPICLSPRKFYQKSETYANTCGNKSCAAISKHKIDHGYREKMRNSQLNRWTSMPDSARHVLVEKRKKTNRERYGGDSPMASEEVRKQVNNTNRERYGVDYPVQSPEIQQKCKDTILKKYGVNTPCEDRGILAKMMDTNMNRYGVPYTLLDEGVKEKMKETNLYKFGTTYPLESVVIRDKAKTTCMERYGVEYLFESPDILAKCEKTNIEKLGYPYPLQSAEIRDKVSKTVFEKYGVSNAYAIPWVREAANTALLEKYDGIHHSQRHISDETIEILNDKSALTVMATELTSNEMAEKLQISHNTVVVYLRKYGLSAVRNQSTFERLVTGFVSAIGCDCVSMSREIFKGLELDIYLPDYNLAIECNGSYWHSELNGKDKNYHLNKTKKCEEKGIQLIHIWEHDWNRNPELVKQRLLTKLGKNERIFARKTQLARLQTKTASDFLNKHHIQGTSPSSLKYGLYEGDELVAVMTFGKSRFSKKYEWELLRYCSTKQVVGGASKLFKIFKDEYQPKSVVSYSDKMWNTGSVYKALGFEYVHTSAPAYYYTKNYTDFANRVQFQKHKLPKKLDNFDPSITEWENMRANGYDRIWDCGNDVWFWYK
jgi:hypothetical protein